MLIFTPPITTARGPVRRIVEPSDATVSAQIRESETGSANQTDSIGFGMWFRTTEPGMDQASLRPVAKFIP